MKPPAKPLRKNSFSREGGYFLPRGGVFSPARGGHIDHLLPLFLGDRAAF